MSVTKLATHERAPLVGGGAIAPIIPKDIEQVFRLATAICEARMAPASYENSQQKVTVGILHGMEVGFTPMAALQSIAVINGMPSIWGDGALGLVESSGKLEDFEESVEGEGEAMVATCRAKRKGRPTWKVYQFSVGDAKKAGLWTKKGPWQDYPKRMLQMRARAFVLRDAFSDVLRGLHIREEVQDMGPLVDQGDGTYAPTPERPNRQAMIDAETKRREEAVEKAAERQMEADQKRMEQEYAGATGEVIDVEPEEEEAEVIATYGNVDTSEPEEGPTVSYGDEKSPKAIADGYIIEFMAVNDAPNCIAWLELNKPKIDTLPPGQKNRVLANHEARVKALTGP